MWWLKWLRYNLIGSDNEEQTRQATITDICKHGCILVSVNGESTQQTLLSFLEKKKAKCFYLGLQLQHIF